MITIISVMMIVHIQNTVCMYSREESARKKKRDPPLKTNE